MMPIHQQLWSLECSVVTVASHLPDVRGHCLAGIQSHCSDKVDDIQTVRKSSTDQCNSSGQLLFSLDQWKRRKFFHFKKLRRLPSAVENRDLEWYSGSGKMSLFDKFIKLMLGVCILHPVFLSDVLSDIIGVTSEYSGFSIQFPKQFCLDLLQVSFLRQKIWEAFYDPPGIIRKFRQEVQLSQRDRATPRVIEYFVFTQDYSRSFEMTLLSKACVSLC